MSPFFFIFLQQPASQSFFFPSLTPSLLHSFILFFLFHFLPSVFLFSLLVISHILSSFVSILFLQQPASLPSLPPSPLRLVPFLLIVFLQLASSASSFILLVLFPLILFIFHLLPSTSTSFPSLLPHLPLLSFLQLSSSVSFFIHLFFPHIVSSFVFIFFLHLQTSQSSFSHSSHSLPLSSSLFFFKIFFLHLFSLFFFCQFPLQLLSLVSLQFFSHFSNFYILSSSSSFFLSSPASQQVFLLSFIPLPSSSSLLSFSIFHRLYLLPSGC